MMFRCASWISDLSFQISLLFPLLTVINSCGFFSIFIAIYLSREHESPVHVPKFVLMSTISLGTSKISKPIAPDSFAFFTFALIFILIYGDLTVLLGGVSANLISTLSLVSLYPFLSFIRSNDTFDYLS